MPEPQPISKTKLFSSESNPNNYNALSVNYVCILIIRLQCVYLTDSS